MIRVRRIEITKEQLRTLPKDERALLLLMGHAMNQIAVLMKLVILSTNEDPADPIEGSVSAAQSILHRMSRRCVPAAHSMTPTGCPGCRRSHVELTSA